MNAKHECEMRTSTLLSVTYEHVQAVEKDELPPSFHEEGVLSNLIQFAPVVENFGGTLKNYTALRIISVIYRIAGVLMGLMATFAFLSFVFIATYSAGASGTDTAGAASVASGILTSLTLAWAAGWFVAGLFCYAAGELICLMIEIVENTRSSSTRITQASAAIVGLGLSQT